MAAALETAISLVEEKEAWKVEKEKDGAVVKSRKNGEGRKVWLCVATVPVSADLLWSKLSDTDTVTTHLHNILLPGVLLELHPDREQGDQDGRRDEGFVPSDRGRGRGPRLRQGLCLWQQVGGEGRGEGDGGL